MSTSRRKTNINTSTRRTERGIRWRNGELSGYERGRFMTEIMIGRTDRNDLDLVSELRVWIRGPDKLSVQLGIYSTRILSIAFLCPQRNFGRHIVIALSVRPSVSPSVPLSCPVHISYILWVRNSKFGVWIHFGMAECRIPFSGHCDLDLDLWPSFYNNHVRSISLILFELGISNLVCGCILGWRSVAYHN